MLALIAECNPLLLLLGPPMREHLHSPAGLIIFIAALGSFCLGTAEFASMSLLPNYSADLHLSKTAAGHVISAYALGVVLGAPILSVFGARFPSRWLLVAFMLLFASGNIFSALAEDYQTLMVARFMAGLPHGAYFGVAMLMAASLVSKEKRALACAQVITGLTIATVVGVPLASSAGQWIGWRSVYFAVAVLAIITAFLLFRFAPPEHKSGGTNIWVELEALKRTQVWLTLAIGAIGFGGLFAVYTYLASTLIEVTHASVGSIPIVLGLLGVGMTLGNLLAARAAELNLMRTIAGTLLVSIFALLVYPFTTHNLWAISAIVILIGAGGGLSTVLQTRLMDVAGNAQTLAAALNHAALNSANALGPWAAGLAIAAGQPLSMTGWVGCALAVCGLGLFFVSASLERNTQPVIPGELNLRKLDSEL